MNIVFPKSQYTVAFNKTAKTITINGVGNITSIAIKRIVNVTDSILMYDNGNEYLSGTIVKNTVADTLVVTLDYDTSAMDNTDSIAVYASADDNEMIFDSLTTGGLASAVSSVDLGTRADSAATTDTGAFSLIALTKRFLAKLTSGIIAFGKMSAVVADSFTRPSDTTAYAAGDAIQNATSSPAERKLVGLFPSGGGSGYLSMWLWCANATVTPRIRVHLFNALPATRANDNAAFSIASGDASKYLGYIDLDTLLRGQTQGINKKEIVTSSTDVWYDLETLDAFTPASGTSYRLSAIMDSNV